MQSSARKNPTSAQSYNFMWWIYLHVIIEWSIIICSTLYGNISSDTYLAVRQWEDGEEDESNLDIHYGGNLIFGNLNSQNKKYWKQPFWNVTNFCFGHKR